MDDQIEIPPYFICPISLQIMKDPVTATTGITYDYESIKKWLSSGNNTTCPVTKQSLLLDSDLTPNHTLRRLIQSWYTSIPPPKPPLQKKHILKLIQDLRVPQLQLESLIKLESLASEKESNRRCMVESGVGKAMVSLIIRCFKETRSDGIQGALNILLCLRIPNDEVKLLLTENYDFVDSIMWVLKQDMDKAVKTKALNVFRVFIEGAGANIMDRLKPESFQVLIQVLRDGFSKEATRATLHILLEACLLGRNRVKINEASAVAELIELELTMPDKRTTELILGVLDYLCSCADGRAQFLAHSAGIAMLAERILRVSSAANESAVRILASIAKHSATNEVLHEMLRVGAVSKICMVLQAHCGANVKEFARGALKLHSKTWNNSPCIATHLITR